MSVEENKVIARRFGEDVWGKGDLDTVDELFAHGFVDHRAFPGQAPGPEGQKQNVVMTRSAFPDLRITNEDIIAKGDKVVLRWTGHGTHRGELMGIAPTGNHVEMGAMDLFRVAGARSRRHGPTWT